LLRPSSALKKEKENKEIREKTSNWSKFNEILQNDFNIDPDTLTKEEKYLCKEF